ncbi:antitoxin [Paracidovorax citrulli]
MATIAKIFTIGRAQAVRLPREFRFASPEVYIRRDAVTGDVVLSRRPDDWDDFFNAVEGAVPDDFLANRDQAAELRDPLKGLA